jgi:hypothetical protein
MLINLEVFVMMRLKMVSVAMFVSAAALSSTLVAAEWIISGQDLRESEIILKQAVIIN